MKITIEEQDEGYLITFHYGFRNNKTVAAENLDSLFAKVKTEITQAFEEKGE